MNSDCIFCKIAAGQIPSKKLAETGELFAFADINPQAPVHALVVPKRHIASLLEADVALLGPMHEMAMQVAGQLGILKTGFRTVINTGRDANQTVPHLHLHLLGGRAMGWPPG